MGCKTEIFVGITEAAYYNEDDSKILLIYRWSILDIVKLHRLADAKRTCPRGVRGDANLGCIYHSRPICQYLKHMSR